MNNDEHMELWMESCRAFFDEAHPGSITIRAILTIRLDVNLDRPDIGGSYFNTYKAKDGTELHDTVLSLSDLNQIMEVNDLPPFTLEQVVASAQNGKFLVRPEDDIHFACEASEVPEE